jgi:hypothetical protein
MDHSGSHKRLFSALLSDVESFDFNEARGTFLLPRSSRLSSQAGEAVTVKPSKLTFAIFLSF